jgi:hypothetical protein
MGLHGLAGRATSISDDCNLKSSIHNMCVCETDAQRQAEGRASPTLRAGVSKMLFPAAWDQADLSESGEAIGRTSSGLRSASIHAN